MSKSVPLKIAELENCRKVLLRSIAEADKLDDPKSKVIGTLYGALKQIEQELSDFRSGKKSSKESTSGKRKKPAA